jgi:hypothetical protein
VSHTAQRKPWQRAAAHQAGSAVGAAPCAAAAAMAPPASTPHREAPQARAATCTKSTKATLRVPRMHATPPPRTSHAGQRDRAVLAQTAVAHAHVRRGPGGAENCATGYRVVALAGAFSRYYCPRAIVPAESKSAPPLLGGAARVAACTDSALATKARARAVRFPPTRRSPTEVSVLLQVCCPEGRVGGGSCAPGSGACKRRATHARAARF